jgi:hypothetical protein
MRRRLLLLALCLCALGVMLGQNEAALVGMPELGVMLTGTPDKPEVVSNSGRGILGYVILPLNASGLGSFMPTLKTEDLRLALVRPTSASGPMATPPRRSSFGKGSADGRPIVKAILDAVIFDDGQYAGPDSGQYFEILSGRVDGERALAQAVSGKKISWDDLEVLDPQRPPAEAFARLEALALAPRPCWRTSRERPRAAPQR